jgi:hypothetical protein
MLAATEHFDDVEPRRVGQDLERRDMHTNVYVHSCICSVNTEFQRSGIEVKLDPMGPRAARGAVLVILNGP